MKIKKFYEKHDYINIIRKLMIDLHEKIGEVNKSDYYIDFDKKYGVSISIHIEKKELETINMYHAQTSIENIIRNNFKTIHIDIYIEDDIYNQNKIYSILAHEMSHYYQVLSGNDIYFESFNKMIKLEDFINVSIEFKKDFLNYIYYNFQHELDARVNQAYEGYLYSKLKTLDEMYFQFMNNKLYKMLIFLNEYNSKKMVNKYENTELLNLTNQFNVLYDIDQINIVQLSNYYNNWEVVFKTNSEEYIKKSKGAIKQAFNKDQRYEKNIIFCYDERPLYEKYNYDMDEEINKLVNMFKELPL